MLAWHLGWRYLRRRRAAWLAVAAAMLSVAVPVVVLGVTQGWLDITARQVRANESDITLLPWSFGAGIEDTPGLRRRLEAIPGVGTMAPFVSGWSILVPRNRDNEDDKGVPCEVDGIEWGSDLALGRLRPAQLHQRPALDLSARNLQPGERGSGFCSTAWRSELAWRGLDLAAALGVGLLPPAPRSRPPVGVVVGRELLYAHNLPLGLPIVLASTTGARLNAVIADTIGTGVLQIDQYTVLLPLPPARQLFGYQARDGRPPRIDGYRIAVGAGADLPQVAQEAARATGLRGTTWAERRPNAIKSVEIQRNITVLVMLLIQVVVVFLVYSVFSTLVAEKRHDIGVLLGLGARRRQIAGAFLLAGVVACVGGGLLGWALGWVGLASLNPFSRLTGIPLFPQDVFYTPEAPISWDPRIPLLFLGVMALVGLASVALPAWRAARIRPVETLREAG